MRRAAALLLLLAASTALAQTGPALFAGPKPPLFKEQELDRRFAASRLNTLLMNGGLDNPACLQLVGAMFTALGEIAPYLHKRDENFQFDPFLQQAFATQLDSAQFPASMYLAAMVRRVLIDGNIPQQWLQTAAKANQKVQIIDLAKLKYLASGVRHIDSSYFTYEELRQRMAIEVGHATNVSKTTAATAFRDTYLDREVAWANLTLVDISPAKGKKGLVAHLEWTEAGPKDELVPGLHGVSIFPPPKRPTAQIFANLSEQQFAEVFSFVRGTRVMVKGRLFEISGNLGRIGIREAQLFMDRDWSRGAVLANPADIVRCPAAINDVAGTGQYQPGGFGQHLGR